MGVYCNENKLKKIAQAQQLTVLKQIVLDTIFPVGSIYMSVNSTSPATLFGGTWEQMKDRFLLGAGDSYSNASTGGSATHTLTVEQLPLHTHTQSSCNSTGAHTHTFNETGGTLVKIQNGGSSRKLFYKKSSYWPRTTTQNGGHTHTCPLNNAGSGGAHNNMPPYLVVMMWKRTG